MLPDLLGGLRGSDLVQVAHGASYTLRDLGYPDLGRGAARLALTEARDIGRPEWIGIAEWMRIPLHAAGDARRASRWASATRSSRIPAIRGSGRRTGCCT
ncbi:hypothetical protein DMB66_45810 [Actinoplanes sp. ATCC 53533]|uniref:hypothetical protein n=1 Tax=Actinoplanes sp. ATCC 53533 TaxID=1288362 RepID=UPI000F7AB8CC|nr:hypothetical protein [Actinoplanes sp. ATCC 53533]RSM48837.1 hypothetical protein DMB66_45810 [Actinoplanes sp. ATCC 53533]